MSTRLARLVTRHPRAVLLAALLSILLAAPLALRLRLDTDMVDLLPRGAPAAGAFVRFTRAFAEEQVLFVLVEGSDGARLTDFADRYAAALRAHPGIIQVRERVGAGAADFLRQHLLQLLDEKELDALAARTTPEALGAQARRLRSLLTAPGGSALAPLLTADPLELTTLLGRRLQSSLPVDTRSGYFRSADGHALLIFVRPATSPFDIAADRRLLDDATRLAERLGGRASGGQFAAIGPQPTVSFTGPYAYAPEYAAWLEHDLQVSTIVSTVAVLLFFGLLLGALRALPWVALPLLLGLWLMGGAAALIYGRINAVSLAFATILLAIGIDLPIQFYNRLREELSEGDVASAVSRTLEKLAGPSLLATLGPAAVFFACRISDYPGLAQLGVLAGLGLLVNLAVMLTVLPSLLLVLPAPWWLPRRRPSSEGAWFAWLGRQASRRPRLVLGVLAVVTLAAVPLVRHVRFDRRLLALEPPAMIAARVTREIGERMGGRRQPLVVLVEDMDRDRALARSDEWLRQARRLEQEGLLASSESVSSLFPSLEEQTRRRARLARLDPARIARDLKAALEEAGFDPAPFQGFLGQLTEAPPPIRLADAGELGFLVSAHVHDGAEGRLVTTYLYPAAGRQEAAFAAVEQLAATSSANGQVTGIPVLEDALYRVLRRDTLWVSLTSVALVLALLVAYYRRLRPILAVFLPLSLAWVLFAAALALFDLPLNLFNLIAIPLVVGYGIDDHIFLLARYRERPELGPEHALASTGRAIVVTSLSTIAGFAGLIVARFDGLRLLGLSGALAVALCLVVAALVALPALLSLLWPRPPT